MKIVNHRLVRDDGTPYPFRPTPNQGGTITPRWLVMHYTAGGSAQESINWMANPQAKASAHIVIAKNGSITQMVDFNRRAFHAGESKWKGVVGLNGHSIGIELDGFGYLGNAGPGKWKFRSTTVPDSEVVVATHKFGTPKGGWPKYPKAQIDAAIELAKLLVKTYRLEEIIGHDDISPGRKQDPGPSFDMAGFRAAVMGQPVTPPPPPPDGTTFPRFRVTASSLNVRGGPGPQNATVPGSPLPSGAVVRGLEDSGGWKRIAAEDSGVTGWVSAQFLQPVPAQLFTVSASSLNVRSGPGASNPTVPGSPLPKDAVVQELEERDGWKRVVAVGPQQVTGWVSAQFLTPALIPVADVGAPAGT